MGKIENTFSELNLRGRKVFIAYITAGDPSLEATVSIVRELEANGVDMVELGVPFSDPIADGPVNQEAANRALKNVVNLEGIFGTVRSIRQETNIPLILFTYYNILLQYGLDKFVLEAEQSGIDGVLVLDLPPEEAGEYKALMNTHNLETIFLVSPVTPEERIEHIARLASGFVYYVSQMGVTGERRSVAAAVPGMIQRIKEKTSVPVAVGFGISTPDHVREVASYVDGLIVGSAIVKRIGELGTNPGFEKEIGAYAGKLTAPLKGP